jgi:hypothetical protein
MKYWEIIADKLSAAGWTWGHCSAVTRDGWRWIVDVRGQGCRYIVESDELLSAFLELKRRGCKSPRLTKSGPFCPKDGAIRLDK